MVQFLILAQTALGNNVVLIGYSSCGVISNSAIKGLVPSTQPGRVLELINIAIFIVLISILILSFLKSLLVNPSAQPHWSSPDPTAKWPILSDSNPVGLIRRLYHDVLPAEAEEHVSLLRKQTLASMTAKIGIYAGWRDVRMWYLVTTKKKAMVPDCQNLMILLAREAGADITTREIESGHSPFISRTAETVYFVLEAVDAMRRR